MVPQKKFNFLFPWSLERWGGGMLIFVGEYFTWNFTTLRISRDLKSLVATGDPKEPYKKTEFQTALFLESPMILILRVYKIPFPKYHSPKKLTRSLKPQGYDLRYNFFSSLFADPIRQRSHPTGIWGFLDLMPRWRLKNRMSLKRSKRPMRSLKPLNGDLRSVLFLWFRFHMMKESTCCVFYVVLF